MIHSKSLIRRLAYVPWLLAFGLVLGWAGEAAAQDIRLTVDKSSLREDGGAQTFKVTATNYASDATDAAKTKVSGAKIVLLTYADNAADAGGLNVNYTVTQAAITIANDADNGSAEITITPIVLDSDPGETPTTGDGTNADFTITISGTAGNFDTATATNAEVLFIDTHKVSSLITLSVDPAEVKQNAGETTITVTGTLNGERINRKNLTFPLIVVGDAAFTQTSLPNLPTGTVAPTGNQGVRDTDYRIPTMPSLTIPRKKEKGTATFTIDPKNGPVWIGIGTPTLDPAADGETGFRPSADLRYDAVSVDDDATSTDVNESLDGTNDAGTLTAEEQEITVVPTSLTIAATTVADIKSDGGLTASPAMVREEDGVAGKEITLKVVLSAALPKDAEVNFTVDPATSENAERDINFAIEFGDLTIEEGDTEGTTTATLMTYDDEATEGDRVISVKASVAGSDDRFATITIIDSDQLTENITLTADPATVSEDAGLTEVNITATIDGQVFDDDLKLTLVLDAAGTATRDVDYTATLRSLVIPKGEISGSKVIDIIPIDDAATVGKDADETIIVTTVEQALKNDDDDTIAIANATIKLGDTGVKEAPTDPDDTTPVFAEADALASATAIEGVAGMALEDKVLPAATGDGDLTYSVSANLPDGLSFDTATRTLSGTPTDAGTTGIVYTVVDGDTGMELPAESAVLTYNIEISETPDPEISVESVSVTQSSIREDGETTAIVITAELAGDDGAEVDGVVAFTIGAPEEGAMALRDVHYTAVLLGSVSVMKGATQATSSLTITPVDNDVADGNKSIGIHATGTDGEAAVADIEIADDETASTAISLSADPSTVSEDADTTPVTITASLNGKERDVDTAVSVEIDLTNSQADRDVDYSVTYNPNLTIAAGSISGSITLQLDPIADEDEEDSESIVLIGSVDGLEDGTAQIRINDAAMMEDDDMMMALAFAEGAMIADIAATAGTPIEDTELPEASGGSGDIVYGTSELPDGLSFDPETRTLSGTPTTAAEAAEVTYTATDGEGATVQLSFSITVNEMLDFGDLGALLGAIGGVGKANPASEHETGVQWAVDQPIPDITLPNDAALQQVGGGTPPYTLEVSGLPAGVSFDATTRTISGTPTEVGSSVFLIVVVDANGARAPLLQAPVEVLPPPLAAPSNVVAQDYPEDNGGFLLLSWDLSEHHEGLDGYRIYREVAAADGEFIPWAMVDNVPGVDKGYAIVATLDNLESLWAVAAERGRQTARSDAVAGKAVFVSAENLNQPYELMAETLMASREAAQAGDGLVFATLLPEALAYAQGVTPKLKSVDGVLQTSALAVTEERVRSIDNIAPLAVPALSVLDAPDDEGSRIGLTWTLSPSDRVLQGVVAEATGPAAIGPVVGVYGYSIYRRAAGEDEFAKIEEVDAGVASFVDEMALNGVRYTYQVRPYDQDNEPAATVEHTAMAVRNIVFDSDGRAIFGLFGSDNRVGFDDFFILADLFSLTAEDAGFDPAFDLAPNGMIDFDDFFVFADNFNRSTPAAGKRVPMLAGLNADARLYLDARTALPNVGEDFVLDVRLADFAAIKGYGLQVQYEADKLEFVEVLTDQPLGGSELATPQVLSNEAGVLAVAALGDVVLDGEVALSLVFRPTTEIENTVIEITDNQTYDSAFGFNRLGLPAPVQVQTRPEVFALANNYPNPFNPATTIKYALPQAADVELTVYNVLGQPVRTLVAEHQSAGRYVVEWDATNDSGRSLSSGMYFYRLEAGGEFLEFKKMLLLK